MAYADLFFVCVCADKGKLVEPSDILKEYQEVMEMDTMQLGVEIDDLEMAWELCAEDGKQSFRPKEIVSLVDDKFWKSSLDAYKAFRLLTSDLGKVFFKAVNANEYKAKAAKSVESSKQNWCGSHESADWCMV